MVGLRAPGAEGGVEQVVAALGPRLVARGCAVTVFCRSRYNRHGDRFGGMDLVDVPTVYTKHLEAIVHTGLSMPRAARGFDVVHVHAVGNALWSFVPRWWGVPTVVTVHALDWQREKWGRVARGALRAGAWAAGRCADAIITVSEETRATFAPSAVPVVRIPNGVDAPAPEPLAAAGAPGLEPGFFLYLGRLVPEKNLETLLRAHTRAATGRKLVITGSHGHAPAYFEHLRATAGPDVVFTGPKFGPAKAALLHHAAAFCTPSRLEGLPLSVLEAMACGRCVLASDIPAHRELLADGAGRLIPADDEAAWADAMRLVASAPDARVGERARLRAEARYGWDPIADRTLEVYRDVVNKRVTRLADRGAPAVR